MTTTTTSDKKKNSTRSAQKNATKQNGTTTQKVETPKVEKSNTKVVDILKPSAKSRISKLETLNILAEKHKAASEKYDELTHFIASNDGTSGNMKFASDSNYSFTIKNPVIINEILTVVESKLSEIVENTEKEVLSFNI